MVPVSVSFSQPGLTVAAAPACPAPRLLRWEDFLHSCGPPSPAPAPVPAQLCPTPVPVQSCSAQLSVQSCPVQVPVQSWSGACHTCIGSSWPGPGHVSTSVSTSPCLAPATFVSAPGGPASAASTLVPRLVPSPASCPSRTRRLVWWPSAAGVALPPAASSASTPQVQEKLEQEITELKRRDAELEQLSHTEDHIQFLHIYPSLPALSGSTHSSRTNTRPLRYFEDVTAAVSELRDQIQEVLKKTWTNISLTVTEVDVLLSGPEPGPKSEQGS
ncbi:uncharacterized protein LOC129605124 [Betta splendens]|uniref:Uncharacterized protein LOC129605124 n=1 Tax=Betta splendens TaxID=158456 RepID=A0A9W2Y9F1_BETSP|nr:uncharacterized protein LOC129605124 [Betta splendens]